MQRIALSVLLMGLFTAITLAEFCQNDPVNNIDPLGLENVVVSGTDGAQLASKGVRDPDQTTTYLDYAGVYYFGSGNFESVGSFMTPLAFGRKPATLPVGFICDVLRLQKDTLHNLATPNFFVQDVEVNGGRIADLLIQSQDPRDVLMGHSQGVTLIAEGLRKASQNASVRKDKVIKLILLAPKFQAELLEQCIEEAKKNQPAWKIDVLIIGNRHDNAIPYGTKHGYTSVRNPDPLLESARVKNGPALFTFVARERAGAHYGRGFPLNRTSPHWKIYEFSEPNDPHDSHKHTGIAVKQGVPVAMDEEPYERIRNAIQTFISD